MQSPPRLFNWSCPPETFALANDEVHVWVANLDDDSHLEKFKSTLSLDEMERATRFHFKHDQNHFIAGRGLLRAILSAYTGTPAASLQFNYGTNGKPGLIDAPEFDNLNFNLAHSGGVAVYAFARNRALGIDLEHVCAFPDMEEIAARCFLPEEQIHLRSLESPRKEKAFFRCWTQKEAVLKCCGKGFSDGHEMDTEQFDGIIHELEPAENYIATLAVHGEPFILKNWQYRPE